MIAHPQQKSTALSPVVANGLLDDEVDEFAGDVDLFDDLFVANVSFDVGGRFGDIENRVLVGVGRDFDDGAAFFAVQHGVCVKHADGAVFGPFRAEGFKQQGRKKIKVVRPDDDAAAHAGFLAQHTRRPWTIRRWENPVHFSGGKSRLRSDSIFVGSWLRVSPRRRESRLQWVSTMMAGV